MSLVNRKEKKSEKLESKLIGYVLNEMQNKKKLVSRATRIKGSPYDAERVIDMQE